MNMCSTNKFGGGGGRPGGRGSGGAAVEMPFEIHEDHGMAGWYEKEWPRYRQ